MDKRRHDVTFRGGGTILFWHKPERPKNCVQRLRNEPIPGSVDPTYDGGFARFSSVHRAVRNEANWARQRPLLKDTVRARRPDRNLLVWFVKHPVKAEKEG